MITEIKAQKSRSNKSQTPIHDLTQKGKSTIENQLINGRFHAVEAQDMLISIIDKQINSYKLQRWSQWEGNHSSVGDDINEKIKALSEQKEELKVLIEDAKKNGNSLNLISQLKLEVLNA